jgi:hypothetical protein
MATDDAEPPLEALFTMLEIDPKRRFVTLSASDRDRFWRDNGTAAAR